MSRPTNPRVMMWSKRLGKRDDDGDVIYGSNDNKRVLAGGGGSVVFDEGTGVVMSATNVDPRRNPSRSAHGRAKKTGWFWAGFGWCWRRRDLVTFSRLRVFGRTWSREAPPPTRHYYFTPLPQTHAQTRARVIRTFKRNGISCKVTRLSTRESMYFEISSYKGCIITLLIVV